MPELPEVETIRRGLTWVILNKKIVQVKVLEPKSVIFGASTRRDKQHSDSSVLGLSRKLGALVGQAVVTRVRRFGKALVIDFDKGISLMIHLRMTGQLVFESEKQRRLAGGHPTEDFVNEMPGRQTRVIFEFENGKLYFNDQRKFGFVKALETGKVEEDEFIRKLGKEPWAMSGEEFYEKLQKHKKALIKAVILDQSVVAGLGNIYADEALFLAGVLPTRRAGEVGRAEAEKILVGAREAMSKSIESGGSTLATYVKADGTRGDYLEAFAQVFNRQGKKCGRCGAEIEKIRVAGRGTHICRGCQK